MKNNFQQFAASGNPWSTPQAYNREEADAANPKCSTGRRRSARQYVEIRERDQKQKSHNMRFSEPTGPVARPKRTKAALVLSIRKRLADREPEPAALADWQTESRVFVQKADVAAGPKSEPRVSFKLFLNTFRQARPALKTHILFTYYSQVVEHYGSVEAY